MAVVVGDADQVRTGPGRILIAPFGTALPATHDAALDVLFVEVGFTTEGSELEVSNSSEGVVVAERLRPVRYENVMSEAMFRFSMSQISPAKLQLAMNGGTITTTAQSVKYVFPKTGGSSRQSVIWESEDGLERLVLARCFSSGAVTIPRRKAPEQASIPIEFRIEENSGADDMWYTCNPSLVAV